MKVPRSAFSTLLFPLLLIGCSPTQDSRDPPVQTLLPTEVDFAQGAGARPFRMGRADFDLAWGIVAPHEQLCGGGRIAGGAVGGGGTFTHLGLATIEMSAAWDIDRLIAAPRFAPQGPAGGPVATVLSEGEYPYAFHVDPSTGLCGAVVQATGELVLKAANGDEVHGRVAGGETHRLDFLVPGDGIETFAIIDVVGGSGRFAGATGTFVVHTIARFDYLRGRFVIDLAEVLPGGTIGY
jgi:hypothetical protein